MRSLVLIGQVLLVPRDQVIDPMDERSGDVQGVAFRCGTGHDTLSHKDSGNAKHFIREGKLRDSGEHLEGGQTRGLGKLRAAQLADDFVADIQFKVAGVVLPPLRADRASAPRDLAGGGRAAFAEKAGFEIDAGHCPIISGAI